MPVRLEDLSSVKKVLHVEVPQEEVKQKMDEAYRDLSKKVKVKGFRPGKVPRNVLKRLYKSDVDADVSQNLIQTTLFDAIREHELRMVGAPDIAPFELDEAVPFRYDATVEIAPDIPDIDYSGLKLKKSIYPVGEEEIDAQLRMLQKKVSEHKPVTEERPVQKGDFVVVDYEATQEGAPFEAIGSSENHTLEIGRAAIAPEIDEALPGKMPGETVDVQVAFPGDYGNANLAGQTVDFRITIKEIREEVLPPIDDELAKNFGAFANLDALRDAIRANLKQGYDKRSEQEISEQVFSALLEQTDFEVPDTLVESETNAIIEDFRRQFESNNITMESLGITPEKIAEDHRETAVQQVRRHLILSKLIEQMNLELPDEELQEPFQSIAQSAGATVDAVREHYTQNQEKLSFLKHTLLEKKAIDLIIENSDVEEVEAEPEADARAAEAESPVE